MHIHIYIYIDTFTYIFHSQSRPNHGQKNSQQQHILWFQALGKDHSRAVRAHATAASDGSLLRLAKGSKITRVWLKKLGDGTTFIEID